MKSRCRNERKITRRKKGRICDARTRDRDRERERDQENRLVFVMAQQVALFGRLVTINFDTNMAKLFNPSTILD